jgi:hypothetical protein
VSLRVDDPSGVEWTVSRDWFGLPTWTRFEGGGSGIELLFPGDVGGDGSGGLVGLFVLLAALAVLLALLWFVVVPALVFLLAVVVALLALAARVLSLSAWTVTARSPETALQWRVRGLRRSRRTMHGVAGMLERGEQPLVDGVPGSTG